VDARAESTADAAAFPTLSTMARARNATATGVLERVAAGVDGACDEIDQFARAQPGFTRAAASPRAAFSRGLNRSLRQ
jgi:hypothetical protein